MLLQLRVLQERVLQLQALQVLQTQETLALVQVLALVRELVLAPVQELALVVLLVAQQALLVEMDSQAVRWVRWACLCDPYLEKMHHLLAQQAEL